MDDPPRGLIRMHKIHNLTPSGALATSYPAAFAVLLGLLLALPLTICLQLFPSQANDLFFFNDTPIPALILASPLILAVLIASLGDWFAGSRSLAATLRHLLALLLVVGLPVLALLRMPRADALGVAVSYLMLGFAIGLGATFVTNANATYADPAPAIYCWAAFMLVFHVGVLIYFITYQRPANSADMSSVFFWPVFYMDLIIIVFFGVTSIPIGGIVGGRLRRGYRVPSRKAPGV